VAEGEGTAPGGAPSGEEGQGVFRAHAVGEPRERGVACRFLARETADGAFSPAVGGVDGANRCVALGEPVPQSAQQQELVCLAASHVNCPRYLRGILVAATPLPPAPRAPISRAVIGATLVLLASLAASFGFLAVRGGFQVPLATRAPDLVAAAGSASPAPTASATAVPVASATPASTPTASPSPSATPTATPTIAPPPTPSPTLTVLPTRTPTPTSDRYAVLTTCPSQADCWIYVVRAGDNLRSIVNWFGVSYERVLQMNPWINDPTTIHAGDSLKIPTPTR
jgi:LysM repeat protein